MSAVGPNLIQLAWLLFSVVIGSMQVFSAVLLLRERGIGPKLMLVGGVISLVLGAAMHLAVMFLIGSGGSGRIGGIQIGALYSILGGASALGTLLFAAGLLVFALQRRAMADRVEELERIIAQPPRA